MTQSNTMGRAGAGAPRNSDDRPPRYFAMGFSALMLALLLLGFSKTYFLRPLIGSAHLPIGHRHLPWHVHLHAVVMTGWYVLIVVQAALAATGRRSLHRRLGLAAFSLSLLLMVLAAVTMVGAAARFRSGDFLWDHAGLSIALTGDALLLPLFALFLAGAFRFRHSPATHWRLVLLASITFLDPALSRIGDLIGGTPVAVFATGMCGQLALLAALALHDGVTTGRVHRVTRWGGLLLAIAALIRAPLGLSPVGQALMRLFQ